MKKDVLIMTCSSKHGELCVAGIDLSTNQWIRLVGSDNSRTNEIPRSFMYYEDYTACTPLDIVSVEIIRSIPGEVQTENVLVDLSKKPVYKRTICATSLEEYISNEKYIYNSTSSYMGYFAARRCNYSLALFKVQNICLHVLEFEGKHKKKVSFNYKGEHYEDWSMTDPVYYSRSEGRVCDEGLIVVSIPEDDYNGNYYKFVSKIIEL